MHANRASAKNGDSFIYYIFLFEKYSSQYSLSVLPAPLMPSIRYIKNILFKTFSSILISRIKREKYCKVLVQYLWNCLKPEVSSLFRCWRNHFWKD